MITLPDVRLPHSGAGHPVVKPEALGRLQPGDFAMSQADGADILKQIADAGRRVLPMHEFMAKEDPSGLSAYNEFLTSAIYSDGPLDDSVKELVLACICIAFGSAQPVIANHCKRSIAAGMDPKALLQAIEITSCVAATRMMSSGVLSLMDATKDD